MSSRELTPATDFKALTELAFGDAEFQTIDIDEDYDTSDDRDGAAKPISGSKREEMVYSHSLGMGVSVLEQIVLLDRDPEGIDPSAHTITVEYEDLEVFDAVHLDENRIVTEIQDRPYDVAAARDRIVKALSAVADTRLGFTGGDELD